MDIKLPGMISGLSMPEYRAAEAWSKSDLDKIHKSPAHYLAQREEESPALAFGSALHCAVLEPIEFFSRFVVAPQCDRRTKDGKAEFAAFELSAAGKTIITADDNAKISGMRQAIFNHPLAKTIFQDGEAELSFFWIDSATGLKCKCRPDYYRRDGILVDLKSTASCDPRDFSRAMAIYRYHVQAAYYTDGIFNVGDFSGFDAPTDFLFVAIEKDFPYGIRIFRIDEQSLTTGRAVYKRDLQAVIDWLANPDFYSAAIYPDSVEILPLTLPAWAE